MKAIIGTHTIALEKIDNHWIPEGAENVQITAIKPGKLFLQVDGRTFTAVLLEVNKEEKTVTLDLNGTRETVKIKEPLDDLLHSMGLDQIGAAKVANVKAPMPGLVLDVVVGEGDVVKKGDKLLVLEAMKMENVIKAAGEGIVARILIDKGNTVEKNQVLIEFK